MCRSELYIDALNVHKYFIHENEIKLELIRNSDDFLLMYDPDTDVGAKKQKYAIKFKKVELHYKIIKPSTEIKQHHDQQVGKGMYDVCYDSILPNGIISQTHTPTILQLLAF